MVCAPDGLGVVCTAEAAAPAADDDATARFARTALYCSAPDEREYVWEAADLRERMELNQWVRAPDAAEWTFKLRKAQFHDGSPVTAADVLASLNHHRQCISHDQCGRRTCRWCQIMWTSLLADTNIKTGIT